jgi:hypothetical protein
MGDYVQSQKHIAAYAETLSLGDAYLVGLTCGKSSFTTEQVIPFVIKLN